jgi:hypothetical protein
MNSTFKSKALAAVLALVWGGAGLHRFYLNGMKDRWGWLYAASLPASGFLFALHPDWPLLAYAAPAVLSLLVASLETFVIGLTSDEKWDEKYNAKSELKTDSHWPIPAMMVLNLFYGATLLLTVIARAFDLVLTGGAYG